MKRYSTAELKELRAAIDAELDARETQLGILTQTLEQLLQAGAPDEVIERVMSAIDVIDSATLAAQDEPEPEPEIDVSDRKRVIAELRAQGYNAPGVDSLIRLYHRDIAEHEYLKAEQELRGHMIRNEHAGYSARRLWFCNLRELRKYATDEMLTWFDENRRITYPMLRDQLLTGHHYAGSGYLNNR
jgi:hypothetical protein